MTTTDSSTDVAAVRRRNRLIYRKQLTGPEAGKQTGTVPTPLALTVMVAPAVVVVGAVCIVYPRTAAILGVVAALALGVLLLLSPVFLVSRLRERRALYAGAHTAAAALPAGVTSYPVAFGRTEDAVPDTEPAVWDCGPGRSGAAGLTASALHLRGPADAALDIALTDILGAVHSAPAPWLGEGSLDLHLHSGEAIELCTPRHKHLAAALASAGVRVLRA